MNANTLASTQGNDNRKAVSPLMNEENQENAGKSSAGNMSKSVKALVRATMAEELAKVKEGSGLGTEPPVPSGLLHSEGEQRNQILSLPGPMPMA